MVLDQTENFVRDSLSSSVTDSSTTFPVNDASVFPDPSSGEYNIVVWDSSYARPDMDPDVEVVRVTGRDTGTDELTVQRAEENSSAASHPSGSILHLTPTAKMMTDVDDEFNLFWDENNQELTAIVNSELVKHSTDITEDVTIGSDEGSVLAGPVTGTGKITGDGRLTVVPEGNVPFSHIFTEDVDAQGNGIKNLSEVSGSWRASGKETQSGDGSKTTFTIEHGMDKTPSYTNVTPASEDAGRDFWVSGLNSTSIEITYALPPFSGTDNLDWYWEAKL